MQGTNKVLLVLALSMAFLAAASDRVHSGENCAFVSPYEDINGWADWCRRCVNGTVIQQDGNPVCVPGEYGARTMDADQAAIRLAILAGQQQGGDVGGVVGGVGVALMQEFLKGMFRSDPAQAARRQAELEAALRQAAVAKQDYERKTAREAQERYLRISSLLKGTGTSGSPSYRFVTSPESLKPRTRSNFFGIPSNPSAESGDPDLQITLRKTAPLSGSSSRSPLAQLNGAAFLSQQAGKAQSKEDAEALANAAFEVVVGGPVELAIPPAVQGAPVSQESVEKFTAIRNKMREAHGKLQTADRVVAETETRKRLSAEIRKEAEKRLEEAKRPQDPPSEVKAADLKAADKSAEASKLAEAQALFDEAVTLDEKMAEELQKAKDGVAKAKIDYSDAEGKTIDFVKGLGGTGDAKAKTPGN